MKRVPMLCLLGALLAGCQDRRTATAPPSATAPPGGLLAAISDGAHGGGNADFFFLPPLVGNPVRDPNFDRGKFNPGLRPEVRVFVQGGGGTDGCPGNPLYNLGVAQVQGASEQYKVDWNTKGLVSGTTYRICVFKSSAGTLLGYLDVRPIAGGMKNAVTGDTYAFQDGRTLPIRFRIEGGECAGRSDCGEFTVGASDATVDLVLPTGLAALSIPPGSIRQGDNITIVIEKQAPPYDGQCLPTTSGLLQSKGCYKFYAPSEEGGHYSFLNPVRFEICVNPQGLAPAALRVWKFDPGSESGPEQLPFATPQLIDCSHFVALADPAASPPASFAAAALRQLGRWAGQLLSPPPLSAAMFAGVPKGIGGTGGSISDFGGAVAVEEGSPDLTFGDADYPSIEHSTPSNLTVDVNVQNFGAVSANNFKVSLQVWTDHYEGLDSLTSLVSGNLTLGAGGNLVVTFTVPCSYLVPSWNYYLKAEADPYNLVVESDEANNSSPFSPPFQSVGSSGSGYCGSGSF